MANPPKEPPTPPSEPLPHALLVETVNQAPVAISITDDRANIIYVNQNFTEITGYAPEESIGCNEAMLSDKRTPVSVYQDLWTTIKSHRTWQGSLLNRHKTGRRYLAHVTISPILNERGKTTHYIGMHRDITEMYTLEQRVKNQMVLIETVVDLMPVATILIDEADRVILDNQMYKALTSDLGQNEPSQLFIDLLREEFGAEWERLKNKGEGFRNREIRFDRGGRHAPRWYACSGSWFSRGDDHVDSFFQENRRTYFLLTLNDITQQKRREEEIRINALRAMMAEEEKAQSLREAILGAVHHIESPLNLLTAAQTMLMRRGPEPQNGALLGILQQILDAGEQSVTRLKTCIPLADTTAKVPININQLLHETIVLLTDRLLLQGVVVDWHPTPLLPSMMGLEHRLRSTFKHIMENAIEAMNQRGIHRRELRISTWPDGNLIHVCIEDTGPGIPEALRVKVFEPFFTTKANGHRNHSGIGLTMAQEVVNQHQGIIRFDPTYQEGCRVHIQFPIRQSRTEPLRPYAHG
ncbi:MAG: sensory box histidine kinase [Proteobacteria bacterium]|nr:sensory box histidine kinase [Pseudomonadota bacterium]